VNIHDKDQLDRFTEPQLQAAIKVKEAQKSLARAKEECEQFLQSHPAAIPVYNHYKAALAKYRDAAQELSNA
jgi:hypothetical protein